jgi:RND family efflux transporter MFP subunit
MTMILRILVVLLPLLWPAAAVAAQDAAGTAGPWVAAMRGGVDVNGGLIRLAAQREGLIAEVLVAENATVEAGQLLARIDDTSARLQLRTTELEARLARAEFTAAELKLRQTESEVARLAPIAMTGAIARKQLEDAERQRDTARADLQIAEARLFVAQSRVDTAALEVAAREIRAPVAGVILRASARVGDATTTNTVTEMFLLAPDGPRVVRGMLDEQFVGKVAIGQRVVLFSERKSGTEFPGSVLRIAAAFGRPGEAQNEARSVEVVLKIEGDAAQGLILGERLVARFLP